MKEDNMADLAEKPTPPEDYECCESGCSYCVWDAYYEALDAWNTQKASQVEKSEELS